MKHLIVVFLLALSFSASAGDWNGSPDNWKNNPNNWENSPNNWKNSSSNWNNSPNKYGNDRLVRDNDGNTTGYAVPKKDGGVNFYNSNGERSGYLPPSR